METFWLEVRNGCKAFGFLEGDEVLVSTNEVPAANGIDLALFELAGERFISRFTRYGSQILLLGDRIQPVRANQLKIIGKIIDGTHKKELSLQR